MMAKKGVNPKPTGLPIDPASRYLPGLKMVPVPMSPGMPSPGFGRIVKDARQLIGRPSPSLGIVPTPVAVGYAPTASGLLLDLDFSAPGVLFQDSGGTTVAAANTDPVGRVNGTGGPAQQVTAGKRPLLELAQQNGRSVLRFDAVDDNLTLASGLSIQSLTMIAVAKTPPTGAARGIMGGAAASGAPAWFFDTGQNLQLNNDGVVALGGGPGAVATGFHVVAVTYATPTGQFYVDGSTFGSAFSTATAFTQPVTDIGSIHSGGLWPYNSDLGRVLIWGRVLSAGELTYNFGWLKTLWGTP